MSDELGAPIDAEFGTWYREFALGPDREIIHKRWKGICLLKSQAESPEIEAMARLAFRTKAQPTQQEIGRIRKPFQDADELFGAGSERELEVLCGAALNHIVKSRGPFAEKAALIVTTTACAGLRSANLPVDLVGKCEIAMAEMAVENRQRPPLSDSPTAKDLIQLLALQDEELQMLWWLVGERSSTLDCAFSSVPTASQALLFASELADMTVVLPGPRGIQALLKKAGIKANKKGGLVNAVNACDPGWLQVVIEGIDPSPATAPIHFAIKRKLETSDDTAWVPGWAAATGITGEEVLQNVTLGTQFYRERLVLAPPDQP